VPCLAAILAGDRREGATGAEVRDYRGVEAVKRLENVVADEAHSYLPTSK
jgi:hypothetical protein